MSSRHSVSRFDASRRLSSLSAGTIGYVSRVLREDPDRAERLAALGVTPGARIRVLQTFPGVIFECDLTHIAVEPDVAAAILVDTTTEALP